MNLSPLPATTALDAYFLEARSKLLDLAAIFDRIERGANPGSTDGDPRLARLQQSLKLLAEPGPNRAEKVQQLFSLPYDPNWSRPTPR